VAARLRPAVSARDAGAVDAFLLNGVVRRDVEEEPSTTEDRTSEGIRSVIVVPFVFAFIFMVVISFV